jgi:hypothetical protein
MEYRGVEFWIVPGSVPNVWRWRVRVGKPEMLRLGEAASEQEAKAQVHALIDRACALEEMLQKRGTGKLPKS